MKFTMRKQWLPEADRLALLAWVKHSYILDLPKLNEHSAWGIQFRGMDPNIYVREAKPLEALKERIRQEFGLHDHPDAEPGWKVWVSVMPVHAKLPLHTHIFRPGYGDLRVNIMLQRCEEGGLAGYVDEEHDPQERDLWFLDGVKPHWVSQVTKGTRIIVSFGFDMEQEKINAMGV